MQKTLLGAAIALIMVLVTALVGPLFVDWGGYRTTVETGIADVIGLPARIGGPIDVRLLPVPTLRVGDVTVGEAGRDPVGVRAAALRIELALGPLLRGEFIASDVALEGPEIALRSDAAPAPAPPASPFGLNPATVAIAHLAIENGRVDLGGGAVLQHLNFSGDARSLLGPARGEGSLTAGGETYQFALDAGRAAADGVRMRLRVDTADHARRGDLDGTLSLAQGVPHLEGDVRWSQTVRRLPRGAGEPWLLAARVRMDAWTAIALEEIDLKSGAADRPLALRGRAGLRLQAQPALDVTLTATRLDLDSLLDSLAGQPPLPRRPLTGLYALADGLIAAAPQLALTLAVSADTVSLADGSLARARAALHGSAGDFDLEKLDFVAPGAAQVHLKGRLGRAPGGPVFAGEARLDAASAGPLVSWLAGDATAGEAFTAPVAARAGVRFDGGGLAFDRFAWSSGGDEVAGDLAYMAPAADRGARLSARLEASAIDLDRLANAAARLAGPAWPAEGDLALKAGRMTVGGVAAAGADIEVKLEGPVLTAERLTVEDFAGARMTAAGSLDTRTLAPRGAATVDLDLRAPDRVAALVERFSGPAAALLRRAGGPGALHGVYGGSPDAGLAGAAGLTDGAPFTLNGHAGAFALDLKGAAALPGGERLSLPERLAAAQLALKGRIDAADGAAFAQAAGLARLVRLEGGAGGLEFTARGRPQDAVTLRGRFTAGGADVSWQGTLQAAHGQVAHADLALAVARAGVRVLPDTALPATFTAQLRYDGGPVVLDAIAGTVGASDVAGRLAIGLSSALRVDGDLRFGALDLAAIAAQGLAAPPPPPRGWSNQAFGGGVIGQFEGRVALFASRGALAGAVAASDLRTVAHFGPSEVTLEDLDADIANGHLSGRLALRREGADVGLAATARLARADLAVLLPADGPLAMGRLDLEGSVEGRGKSPASLIASIYGGGAFHIENGALARLDPAAFDALAAAVDGGLPIETARIVARMEAALARGPLPFQGDGAIAAADGTARLTAVRLQATGADLAASARYDLRADALDARLTLAAAAAAAAGGRPEVAVSLKGPAGSPARTLDVAALSAWLATRGVASDARAAAAAAPAGGDEAGPAPGEPGRAVPAGRREAASAPPAGRAEPAERAAAAARPDDAAVARPPAAGRRITELNRMLSGNPRDGAALAARGALLALGGNYPAALRDLNEALRLQPRNPEALNSRCFARAAGGGDLKAALGDCNAALQVRPRDPDALDSRALVNMKSGQFADAVRDYDAALALKPKTASSLYGRGIARMRSGDVDAGKLDVAQAKALKGDIAEIFAGFGIR